MKTLDLNSTMYRIYDHELEKIARRNRRHDNKRHRFPVVQHGWKGSHVRFSLNTDQFKRAIKFATRAVLNRQAINGGS